MIKGPNPTYIEIQSSLQEIKKEMTAIIEQNKVSDSLGFFYGGGNKSFYLKFLHFGFEGWKRNIRRILK